MSDTFTCPEAECEGRAFSSSGALRLHKLNKHTIREPEECPVCHEYFIALPVHMRKHANERAGKPERKKGKPAARIAAEPDAAPTPPGADPAGGDPSTDEERRPSTPGDMSGPPPLVGKRRLKDRVRGKLWGKADDEPAPPGSAYQSTERKPKRSGARSTTAPILSLLWGGSGGILVRTGADVPVGRVMQFQSEMAGDTLDRLIRDTWLDRVLQPFASKTDELEAVVSLLALPLMVGTMERSPQAADAMMPLLRQALEANVNAMAPVVKKRKAEERKFAQSLADLNIEARVVDGQTLDPITGLICDIFAPPPGMVVPDDAPDDQPASADAFAL